MNTFIGIIIVLFAVSLLIFLIVMMVITHPLFMEDRKLDKKAKKIGYHQDKWW